MEEKKIAIKFYEKINEKILEKNTTYYKIAENLGMSQQNFSDQMKNLKKGKFIKIKTILRLQEYLGIELIKINI